MRTKTAVLAGLLMGSLLLGPAEAAILYSNGAANDQVDSWNITNFGVADSFTLSSPSVVTGADFDAWLSSGVTGLTVDWQILNTPGGTILFSGTLTPQSGTFKLTNTYGFDIYSENISLGSDSLGAGTYWLLLQNAVTSVGGGNIEWWDINGGPSNVWQSSLGDETTCANDITGVNGRCSDTFDIIGTNGATGVPEPSSIALLGAALIGLGGMFRRRRGEILSRAAKA